MKAKEEQTLERFTELSRHVMASAAEYAAGGGITIGHVFLALLNAEDGLAARVLNECGYTKESVSSWLRTQPSRYEPEVKKLLEGSIREALSFGHNYVSTEHLLIALSKSKDSPVADHADEIMERVRKALTVAPRATAVRAKLADMHALMEEIERVLDAGDAWSRQANV